MMADISNAGYSIIIEEISDCKYKSECSDDQPFNLFLFDNTDDYNCYVEAVSLLNLNRQKLKTCDFLEKKDGIIFEQVRKHTMEADRFISKEKPSADVFVVVDNTGWLQAISDGQRKPLTGTVVF